MQARNLTDLTNGFLEGEVITDGETQGYIPHHFDIVAPSLNKYRHRILTIRHDSALLYPVYCQTGVAEETSADYRLFSISANTEAEFIKVLSQVLQSDYVLSVINSLIARINEAQQDESMASQEMQAA